MAIDFTDLSQETLLWSNTELITPEDLTAAPRLSERRLADVLFGAMATRPGDSPSGIAARPIGTGFAVSAAGGMGLAVAAGTLAFRQSSDPGQPDNRWLLHQLLSAISVTVATADGTHPRLDLLSFKVEHDALDTGSVDAVSRVSRDTSGAFSSTTFDKRRRTKLTVTYTAGTPGVSPSAPSTPSGQVALATIAVATSASSIAATDIVDLRDRFTVIQGTPTWRTYHAGGATVIDSTGPLTYDTNGFPITEATLDKLLLPIPVSEDERILQWAVRGFPASSGNIVASLFKYVNGAGASLVDAITLTGHTEHETASSLGTPEAGGSDRHFYVLFTFTAATLHKPMRVSVQTDVP